MNKAPKEWWNEGQEPIPENLEDQAPLDNLDHENEDGNSSSDEEMVVLNVGGNKNNNNDEEEVEEPSSQQRNWLRDMDLDSDDED